MILDLNIPKVDGASVLNNIRGIARVKLLGADSYFIKPMDPAGFAKIASAVIDEKKKARNLSGQNQKRGRILQKRITPTFHSRRFACIPAPSNVTFSPVRHD
jgi:DNA-binding response OmpR family regulator